MLWDVQGAACSRRPEDDPGFIPERPEFAAMRAETAPVVVGKDAQGRKTFKSKLRTGSFYLVFYAVPSANADHFAFYVDVPDPYANKTCDLGFLTDGELVPSSSFNVKTPTGKRIKVVFQSEVLDSFTQSRFVSGRVCDLEWRLQPAQLKILAEFSARYKEEVAWLAKNEAKNNVSTQ